MSVLIKFVKGRGPSDSVVYNGYSWKFSDRILDISDKWGRVLVSFPSHTVSSVEVIDPAKDESSGNRIFINFILDESHSMMSSLNSTIDSFNEYIQGLKERPAREAKNIRFTFTKFNSDRTHVVHNSVQLRNVNKLTQQNYVPAAITPLYDAIGKTITEMEKKVGGANVLCVIQTDGMENASRLWTQQQIFNLITKKQKEGWTFTFLGANQDAWASGGSIGIPQFNTLSYDNSARGVKSAMASLAQGTVTYTSTGGAVTRDFFGGENDIREKSKRQNKKVVSRKG